MKRDDAATTERGDASDDSLLRAIVATPASGLAMPDLATGTVVGGQYRIERPLGRGGMGVVYLARDLRLGRDVAVKVGHATSPSALARIEHEALALAQLSHPNVVTIYQVGDLEGRLYIAMEYVAGGNAREWVAECPRSWREIVALYAAAGDGLLAAHRAGLVHRDFKPDNVLVDRDGRPRVADFGLVRGSMGSGDAAAVVTLTGTGALLGTPAYMAPEQLARADIDHRADQFALCTSLWEALFARRPFASATPGGVATELADLAVAIDSVTPRAPERSGVPAAIVAALRRGLAKDREVRWPTLAPLLAELRRDSRQLRRRTMIGGALAAVLGGAAIVAWRSAGASGPVCAMLATDAPDVFVDAAAPAGGTGVSGCPLRTISDALAPQATVPRVIHVAAGRYDRDHGERFPLVVRGDVSIAGAGDELTRVIGSGRYDHRATGGAFGDTVAASFVIGDARGKVALSGLAIEGDTPAPELARTGILCDRGNLATFAGEVPAANTTLEKLAIGPGFDTAIIATTSTQPAALGCNLELASSTVKGAYIGLWTVGCGAGTGAAPVRAVVGDGTVFKSMHAPNGGGLGIRVWDCTRELAVHGALFDDSDAGIFLVRHAPGLGPARFAIDDSQFHRLTHYGVTVARAAVLASLEHNSFAWNNAAGSSPADRAIALVLDGETESGYPGILHARHNAFVENDVAIELTGSTIASDATLDFGRPDDPGGNSFACNGTARGAAAAGYDVEVAAQSDPAVTLHLAGNQWDHAPPTLRRGGAPNGSDLVVPVLRAPRLDASLPTMHREPCKRDAGP